MLVGTDPNYDTFFIARGRSCSPESFTFNQPNQCASVCVCYVWCMCHTALHWFILVHADHTGLKSVKSSSHTYTHIMFFFDCSSQSLFAMLCADWMGLYWRALSSIIMKRALYYYVLDCPLHTYIVCIRIHMRPIIARCVAEPNRFYIQFDSINHENEQSIDEITEKKKIGVISVPCACLIDQLLCNVHAMQTYSIRYDHLHRRSQWFHTENYMASAYFWTLSVTPSAGPKYRTTYLHRWGLLSRWHILIFFCRHNHLTLIVVFNFLFFHLFFTKSKVYYK